MITTKGNLRKIINFWLLPFAAGGCFSTGYKVTQKAFQKSLNSQTTAIQQSSSKNGFQKKEVADLQSVEVIEKSSPEVLRNMLTENQVQSKSKNINALKKKYEAIPNLSDKVKENNSEGSSSNREHNGSNKDIFNELFQKLPKP